MRNLDRWLGDGGMPIIGAVGASINAYGDGWATAEWTPTEEACNPGGMVQAGVQAVILDALMSMAGNARLERGERMVTLEMKVSNLRGAPMGRPMTGRADITRWGRQIAFMEGWLRDGESGDVVAHATATFSKVAPKRD